MARRRTVPKTCPHTVRLGAPKTVSSRGAERLQAARNVAENRSPTSEKKRCNRIGQLSQILNIPRSSLYAYLPEGWIPCGWISNRWILPDDVEERLRARAYAAVGRGEVPAIRIGRHIRIPPETVEVLLTSTNMQGQ